MNRAVSIHFLSMNRDVKRCGIEVDQMHFAVNLGEPGKVQIVTVSGPEDADSPTPPCRNDEPFQRTAVRIVEPPLLFCSAVLPCLIEGNAIAGSVVAINHDSIITRDPPFF